MSAHGGAAWIRLPNETSMSSDEFFEGRSGTLFIESPLLVGINKKNISSGPYHPVPFLQGLNRIEEMLYYMGRDDEVLRIIRDGQAITGRNNVNRQSGTALVNFRLLELGGEVRREIHILRVQSE